MKFGRLTLPYLRGIVPYVARKEPMVGDKRKTRAIEPVLLTGITVSYMVGVLSLLPTVGFLYYSEQPLTGFWNSVEYGRGLSLANYE